MEFLESFYAPQGKIEFTYLAQASFVLEECSRCRLIYQRYIPDEFLMTKLYTEWINPDTIFQTDVVMKDLDFYAALAQEIMMVIAYFKTLPGNLKFLDFGMGWGLWARMSRAFGCDAYGLELSEKKCAWAKIQGVKVLALHELHGVGFDFINTEQIFEHIADPLETLKVLKNSLKANGLIKISVPDAKDIKRRLVLQDWQAPQGTKRSLNAVSPLEHINCFRWGSLLRMADSAGLEQAKIPLCVQYRWKTNWKLLKPSVKNLLKPLYQNLIKRGTYLFFRKKSTAQSI